MPIKMSWLARVSVCVIMALSPVVVNPALADSKGQVAQSAKAARSAAAATQISQRDLQCLAEALYFEARGEGAQGQRAVAEVILNRVDHPRFPKTVCGVVNQRGQFTYNKNARIREKGTFARVQKVAIAALSSAAATVLIVGGVKQHSRSRAPGTVLSLAMTVCFGLLPCAARRRWC